MLKINLIKNILLLFCILCNIFLFNNLIELNNTSISELHYISLFFLITSFSICYYIIKNIRNFIIITLSLSIFIILKTMISTDVLLNNFYYIIFCSLYLIINLNILILRNKVK